MHFDLIIYVLFYIVFLIVFSLLVGRYMDKQLQSKFCFHNLLRFECFFLNHIINYRLFPQFDVMVGGYMLLPPLHKKNSVWIHFCSLFYPLHRKTPIFKNKFWDTFLFPLNLCMNYDNGRHSCILCYHKKI